MIPLRQVSVACSLQAGEQSCNVVSISDVFGLLDSGYPNCDCSVPFLTPSY